MFAASPFSLAPMPSNASPHASSAGSGHRLSRNVAVSLALQMAESSKDQYYSLLQAFEESEPAHCKSLLHTADNQLLPGIAAASSSLRSLAASASSFDGVLLETKSRELGGIIDSFVSLRKMISEKASLIEPVSPVSASTAAAIAAVATQRIAAACDAAVASPPPPLAAKTSAALSGSATVPQVAGSFNSTSNPFAALTSSSAQAAVLSSSPVSNSSAASSALAPSSPCVVGPSTSGANCSPLQQPISSSPADLTPRVSGSLPHATARSVVSHWHIVLSHTGTGSCRASRRSSPTR